MVKYGRQHWVPQSYLRRFSTNGTHVWMLDKKTGRMALANIRDLAQRKFFNDGLIRDERGVLPSEIPEGAIEERFGKWETALTDGINAALRVADGGGASLEERQMMSVCVALQLTRTPAFRAHLSAGLAAALEADADAFLAETRPDLAESVRAKLTVTPKWSAAVQYKYIWESGEIPRIAADLGDYIWRIGVNQTRLPLCTSDAPVIGFVHDAVQRRQQSDREPAHAEDQRAEHDIVRKILLGNQPYSGLEVIFPLTPTVALHMYHPEYFAEMHTVQGRRMPLGRVEVMHYNALQYLQAERQLYSPENNVEAIRKYAETYVDVTPK